MSTKNGTQAAKVMELAHERVAVLGYGAIAREHALALRREGADVAVGLRFGGMSWVRAQHDGFSAEPASKAVMRANVVSLFVPDDEQIGVYFDAIDDELPAGSLLVLGRGLALATGALETHDIDVVLVKGTTGHVRVAVHHDSSGAALERAIAYARIVFGRHAAITTTTIDVEASAELADMAARVGGYAALAVEVADAVTRACETHAPDEAKVRFYERLRALLDAQSTSESARASGVRGLS